jgi:hypothetical protein
MPRTAVYKYTPGQASPEELEATFVGREALLEQLLTRTQQWCAGAAPEHTLVLGPRGMGKTHLLRLLAHRAARAAGAASLSIAVFPEESYSVGSADELVVELWNRLGMSESVPQRAAPARAAWVLDRLKGLHKNEGFRFLLLLDGLDLLLDQLRQSDEGQIHRLLTTESHICLIGSAAQAPAAVTDHDRPLYQLLRLERLRPLDAARADELLRKRAEWAGDDELLQRWPELGPRARAVAELTGGNPRLLLMLYQSLQLGELPSVIEAFRALLDELTPFYKHVVESRAPQQRKLLLLAAFHDRGASPSELAAESGLPERQVSALLGPLVKDRLLRRVRRPGARTSAYPFSEPLLRMWLQMRASPEGERRVRCVVEFFRVWYMDAGVEYQPAFTEQADRALELRPGDSIALSLRVLNRLDTDRLQDGLVHTLRTIFRAGHQSLCEEALERLTPLANEAALLEPFYQALAYLRAGRDPYFLEALNPDVRRAVELVVEQFGADHHAPTEDHSAPRAQP